LARTAQVQYDLHIGDQEECLSADELLALERLADAGDSQPLPQKRSRQ